MNKKQITIIIFLIVAVAGSGFLAQRFFRKMESRHQHAAGYHCPMHPQITSDKPGNCPICFMKLVPKDDSSDSSPFPMKETQPVAKKEKKILYWTDPMIPNYKSDKPGKSPMGMELVPVYEDDDGMSGEGPMVSGYAPIKFDLQQRQLIGVKTAVVKRQRLTKMIRTVGTVAHDPELYQAQAEYIQTLKQAQENSSRLNVSEQLERLVEASRTRLRHLGISEELIAEMAAWSEPQHSLLFAHPGQASWIYAQVYEYELPFIHVGDSVEVDTPAFPNEIFKGQVRAIDRMVDPVTRATRIRIQLEDLHAEFKLEMYVNVKISIDLGETLAVPQEAVFDTGIQKIVFVDRGEGLFEPRDIHLGAKAAEWYEVKEGLREGEFVVTSGNFLVDSESRLKAVLKGMAQESHGGHDVQ